MRVPSGDSEGHSTSPRTEVTVRRETLPSTSQVLPPDAAVA
jgi:hypothetical protein